MITRLLGVPENMYKHLTYRGNIYSKIINLIYVMDYASIFHAVLNNIDPSPVNAIDFVKNKYKKYSRF